MTLASWPAGIPYKPERSGFSVAQPYAAASVTQFDDGPDRIRQRSFTAIKKLAYVIALESDADCAAVVDFLDNTLAQGTRRFTMPVSIPGAGFVTKTCYLDQGTYKIDPLGLFWSVSFTLCVLMAT